MAYTRTKDRSLDFSYQGIHKVLRAATSDQKADRVPRNMWDVYIKGENPMVILGENNEPPRLRPDVYRAAMQAVEKGSPGAAGAREMLQFLHELHRGRLAPAAERDSVLAVLTAKADAKPLAHEQFNEIRHLLDRDAGGLSKEGWDKYKTDKDVVEAAKAQRNEWAQNPDTKTKDKAADKSVTDNVLGSSKEILALLTAKPGEKPVDLTTYRKLTGTAERSAIVDVHHKGGLTQGAYNAFQAAAHEGNEVAKQIIVAAEAHRAVFVRPQKPEITAENKQFVVAMLNRRSIDEKPLTDEQFNQVNRLFSRSSGALTADAEKQAKDKGFTDVREANNARKTFASERLAEKEAAKETAAPEQKAPQEEAAPIR